MGNTAPPKRAWQRGGSVWAKCCWGGTRRCAGLAAEDWSSGCSRGKTELAWQGRVWQRSAALHGVSSAGLAAACTGERQAVSRFCLLSCAAGRNEAPACRVLSSPFSQRSGKSHFILFLNGIHPSLGRLSQELKLLTPTFNILTYYSQTNLMQRRGSAKR